MADAIQNEAMHQLEPRTEQLQLQLQRRMRLDLDRAHNAVRRANAPSISAASQIAPLVAASGWATRDGPRSTTTTYDASFFDAVSWPTGEAVNSASLLDTSNGSTPPVDDTTEHTRPLSRRGSSDFPPPSSSRDLEQLPPLRRMGNRSINDSPHEREPSSLRDEWRPASEFNNGLGDRERSWSPDVDVDGDVGDHWETHLTTISPAPIVHTAESETSNDEALIALDWPVRPTTSTLHLPVSTFNINICDDDEPEIEHLQHLVEHYRIARSQVGMRGLRNARATLREMRETLERLGSRRDLARAAGGLELSARNREEMQAIMERIRRVDADVETM